MNDQEHKCQCEFRIRMLGDGCRYCQPQEYIDRLHDTMEDMVHVEPLSDEEIEAISETIVWRGSDLLWELDFARAIEERHDIK